MVFGRILSATAHLPITRVSRGEAVGSMMTARRHSREVGVPTLLQVGPYRFHFHSREHDPPHVHVRSANGSAIFFLTPVVLREQTGYTRRHLEQIERLVFAHRLEFLRRWHEYFDQ
jgi:hypothetical protein